MHLLLRTNRKRRRRLRYCSSCLTIPIRRVLRENEQSDPEKYHLFKNNYQTQPQADIAVVRSHARCLRNHYRTNENETVLVDIDNADRHLRYMALRQMIESFRQFLN